MIVVPEDGGFAAACEEYGIPVAVEPRLAMRPMRRDLPASPEPGSAIDDLCSLFTNFSAEVIHCHTELSAAKAITAGNRAGIPCVFTSHIFKGLIPVNTDGLEFSEIGVCRNAVEDLKRKGFPADRIFYVPNGTKVMPRATGGSLPPNLIWVGRLSSVKGPDIAILAMADLKYRQGADCPVLNVYGAGPMEGHLKEIVSVLRLGDKVRFHGAKVGILEQCPATDILIVSSRAEAGPMTALEAMSRRMPIVSTNVGEINEMIPDRRYGHVTKSESSIIELADGIESMLSDVRAGRFDAELPISRHQALFTVERMAERIDGLYKSLITRNAPVA